MIGLFRVCCAKNCSSANLSSTQEKNSNTTARESGKMVQIKF